MSRFHADNGTYPHECDVDCKALRKINPHTYESSQYPDGSSTCVHKENGVTCDFSRESEIHVGVSI